MRSKMSSWGCLLAILVLITTANTGCTGPEIVGAVGEILVGGISGDPQHGKEFGQALQASAEQQQQQEFMLSKLPPGWKCEGASIYYSEDNGCYIYSRPDQSWLKWAGGQWVLGE
jgi:hypothetical protein